MAEEEEAAKRKLTEIQAQMEVRAVAPVVCQHCAAARSGQCRARVRVHAWPA